MYKVVHPMEPPSEEEYWFYFYGLAGGPLIARTSNLVLPWKGRPMTWANPDNPFMESSKPVRKRYVAVGAGNTDQHYIDKIRNTLRPIAQSLDASGIDWTWYTCVRIGWEPDRSRRFNMAYIAHENPDPYPLVLLIHVVPGSTSFEQGASVVMAIREILDSKELRSVHVEMREGIASEFSVPPELHEALSSTKDPFSTHNRVTDALRPLQSYSGWEVVRTDRGTWGTCGLYISCGGKGPLAVTAYHVLMKEERFQKLKKKKQLDQRQLPTALVVDGKPEHDVSQLSQTTYGEVAKSLLIMRNNFQQFLELLREKANLTTKEFAYKDELQREFDYAEAIHAIISTVSKGVQQRVVGHVYLAPEYMVLGGAVATDVAWTGFWNDYVVVQLEPSCFPRSTLNKFDISLSMMTLLCADQPFSPFVSPGWSSSNYRPYIKGELPFKFDLLLEMDAMKSWRDNGRMFHMRKSSLRIAGDNGRDLEPMRVVKKGACTNVTVGITNVIEAVIRQKISEVEGAAHSWEIMVIPMACNKFADHGDSGSPVATADGGVIGMLVSGGEAGAVNENRWRGYKDFLARGVVRQPTGFEKGKQPAESSAHPSGSRASGKDQEYTPIALKKKDAASLALQAIVSPKEFVTPQQRFDQPKYDTKDGIYISFVTPMDFILDDIRRLTGSEVEIL